MRGEGCGGPGAAPLPYAGAGLSGGGKALTSRLFILAASRPPGLPLPARLGMAGMPRPWLGRGSGAVAGMRGEPRPAGPPGLPEPGPRLPRLPPPPPPPPPAGAAAAAGQVEVNFCLPPAKGLRRRAATPVPSPSPSPSRAAAPAGSPAAGGQHLEAALPSRTDAPNSWCGAATALPLASFPRADSKAFRSQLPSVFFPQNSSFCQACSPCRLFGC